MYLGVRAEAVPQSLVYRVSPDETRVREIQAVSLEGGQMVRHNAEAPSFEVLQNTRVSAFGESVTTSFVFCIAPGARTKNVPSCHGNAD